MKNKLVVLLISLTLVIGLAIAGCAAPAPTPTPTPAPAPAPTPAPGEVITWTLASNMGGSAAWWPFTPHPRFQNMVEERSGGRLVFDTKINLVPGAEVAFAVIDGRADIGMQLIPWVSGTYPLWTYASLPFFFETVYEYESAVNDPRLKEILDRNYRAEGLVRLLEASSAQDNGHIFSNRPVATIEDFKGLKVRAAGLLTADAFDALGASPLTMAFAELAPALAAGTVDAVATGASFGIGQGLADVTEYLNVWHIEPTFPVTLIANAESFDALPSDLQQILREASRELQGQIFQSGDNIIRVALSLGEAGGLTLVYPEEAETARATALTAGIKDKWLELAGPDGPAVLEIISEYASGAK